MSTSDYLAINYTLSTQSDICIIILTVSRGQARRSAVSAKRNGANRGGRAALPGNLANKGRSRQTQNICIAFMQC